MSESTGAGGSTAPAKDRRVTACRRVLLGIAIGLVVLVLGSSWLFSGKIYTGALEVRPATHDQTITVVATRDDSITLRETGEAEDGLRQRNVYGLIWAGGYGRLSGSPQILGSEVTREFALLEGTAPAQGALARLDRDAFPAENPGLALGHPPDDVTFASEAGKFQAWFMPGSGETWAILVHGQRGTRAEMLRPMAATVKVGLPSLDISYRNDEGAPQDPKGIYGFGRTEWVDLQGAAQYALDHGAARLVLIGYSMGGSIVASFLERSALASYVSRVILDAPNLSLGETIGFQAPSFLPQPLTSLAKRVASARYDIDWDAVDYLKDTRWLEVPALVFHGTADTTAPIELSERLAEAHPDLVELVKVDGAAHVASWNRDPQVYNRRMTVFLTGKRSR